MSRGLALATVIAILIVVAIAVMRPDWIPGGYGGNVPQLAYLLLALMLVSGAGLGFWRFRQDGGNAVLSLAIWAAIGVAIALLYTWLN